MNPIKKIMNLLLLSCKSASSLIEKKLSFSLSLTERVQLYMHKGMCEACRAYEKQSKDIDLVLGDHIRSQSTSTTKEVMSDDFKAQMIKKLEEEK